VKAYRRKIVLRGHEPASPSVGVWFPVASGGLASRNAAAAPYREAVIRVVECDIDVELVDRPQSKSGVCPTARGRNEACQTVGWASAWSCTLITMWSGVAQMRTIADGRPWSIALLTASVTPISKSPRVASGTRPRPIRLRAWRVSAGYLSTSSAHGRGAFEWIGGDGEGFENRGVLIPVASAALSRGRNDAGMRPMRNIEHRCRCGGGVAQAQARYREIVLDGVDRRQLSAGLCPAGRTSQANLISQTFLKDLHP
jgi:hypothetical protein